MGMDEATQSKEPAPNSRLSQEPATSSQAHSGPRRPYLPWWKRNYIVNRDLQFKFAGSALVMGLVCTISSIAILLISFYSFGIWQGQRLPFPVILAIGFALIVNLVGIMFASILSTQRIVGPLFNLLRQFQKVSRGDFKAHAKFRTSDEIHYVARRFNEMLERLDERENEIFVHIEQAAEALESSDAEKARELIKQARNLRSRGLASG
ncbi:HAMP domain-containing protein [bacterium]|nr:HAMP domain-containing protein [bacterium]